MATDSDWKQTVKAMGHPTSREQAHKMETLSEIEVGDMVEKEWMRFHALTIVGRSSSSSDLAFLVRFVPACSEELSTTAE
jgi:hypothetical protein